MRRPGKAWAPRQPCELASPYFSYRANGKPQLPRCFDDPANGISCGTPRVVRCVVVGIVQEHDLAAAKTPRRVCRDRQRRCVALPVTAPSTPDDDLQPQSAGGEDGCTVRHPVGWAITLGNDTRCSGDLVTGANDLVDGHGRSTHELKTVRVAVQCDLVPCSVNLLRNLWVPGDLSAAEKERRRDVVPRELRQYGRSTLRVRSVVEGQGDRVTVRQSRCYAEDAADRRADARCCRGCIDADRREARQGRCAPQADSGSSRHGADLYRYRQPQARGYWRRWGLALESPRVTSTRSHVQGRSYESQAHAPPRKARTDNPRCVGGHGRDPRRQVAPSRGADVRAAALRLRHALEDDDRDLADPARLLLVVRECRSVLLLALPDRRPLRCTGDARAHANCGGTDLDRHVRVREQVVEPVRVLRRAAGGREDRDRIVVQALVDERIDALDGALRAAVVQEQEPVVEPVADAPAVRAELLDDLLVPVRHAPPTIPARRRCPASRRGVVSRRGL